MQREGREQGIIGGMREIPREELPEAFHQMISASTVRGLAIGLRIVLRGEQEEAEVGQETETTIDKLIVETIIEVEEIIVEIEGTTVEKEETRGQGKMREEERNLLQCLAHHRSLPPLLLTLLPSLVT